MVADTLTATNTINPTKPEIARTGSPTISILDEKVWSTPFVVVVAAVVIDDAIVDPVTLTPATATTKM